MCVVYRGGYTPGASRVLGAACGCVVCSREGCKTYTHAGHTHACAAAAAFKHIRIPCMFTEAHTRSDVHTNTQTHINSHSLHAVHQPFPRPRPRTQSRSLRRVEISGERVDAKGGSETFRRVSTPASGFPSRSPERIKKCVKWRKREGLGVSIFPFFTGKCFSLFAYTLANLFVVCNGPCDLLLFKSYLTEIFAILSFEGYARCMTFTWIGSHILSSWQGHVSMSMYR